MVGCRVLTLVLCAVFSLPIAHARQAMSSHFPTKDGHMLQTGEDPGKPLFLTPYIEKGDIQTARKLSRVGPLGVPSESYSGFLTVNKTANSNMFFWLFPAKYNPKNAPFLLWLQGGPGGSSLFGLFVENGPFGVDKNAKLFPRDYSWTENFTVVYIDNPVQTGFSFSNKEGLATNELEVAENLYRAMLQIFELFPELQHNPFYITGESYAGKYIPALGHRIHLDPEKKIKLTGVAIGDGFTDPEVMVPAYSDFLYQIGLLDEIQAAYFKRECDFIVGLIKENAFSMAEATWDEALHYLQTKSGVSDYYNYLRTTAPPDFNYYGNFLAKPEVRRAIHVGNLTYHAGTEVEQCLLDDMMQSVKPWLAELMDNYKVMLYTGQLDIIVALPLTEAMLRSVQWKGLDKYKQTEKRIWKVAPEDNDVAGYVRQVGDFYQVLVRGGGHILPFDQPRRSFDLINRFIFGKL